MKEINHPKYGKCYEMTKQSDIQFCDIAQGALVSATTFPSGTKTPLENLWIREKYLVRQEHRPPGSPLP